MKFHRTKSFKIFAVVFTLIFVMGTVSPAIPYFSAVLSAKAAAAPRSAAAPVNLIADGDFECYAAGHNMKQQTGVSRWNDRTSGEDDWTTATVTQSKSHSPTHSLQLHTMYTWGYRLVEGLSRNTDYFLIYSYYLPAYTEENNAQLMRVAVAAGTETTVGPDYNGFSGALDGGDWLSQRGTGDWKSGTVAFNSGDNTSVYILFQFFCNPSAPGDTDLFLDDLGMYRTSDLLPAFDAAQGTVTADISNNVSVFTAVPHAGYLFRGWYLAGTETEISASLTLTDPLAATAYTAKFIPYNLVNDGSFEINAAGTDLKGNSVSYDQKWYTTYTGDASADWTQVLISDDRAYTGTQSLKIKAMHNTAYRLISGLTPNTQYTIQFRYWLPAYDNENQAYLNNVSVVSANDAVSALANMTGPYLNRITYGTANGKCDGTNWKEASISFYSGEEEAVYFCINYSATAWPETFLYLDDLVLTEDPLAAPVIRNGNFENGNADEWNKPLASQWISFEASNERPISGSYSCKVTSNFAKGMLNRFSIFSEQIPVKKGYTYTFQITVDRTDYYIANENNLGYVWMSLSTTHGYQPIDDLHASFVDWHTPVETKTLTYTADFTGGLYVCLSLLHGGSIQFDDFSVTETAPSSVSQRGKQAVNVRGAAIRTQSETAPQGIRCKTRIDKRLLSSDGYYGLRAIEFGTLAIRSDYLNGQELVKGGTYQYQSKTHTAKQGVAYSLAENKSFIFAESTTTLDYTGVLTGIKEELYTAEYTVRAYAICLDASGNQVILYSDAYSPSIYQVAKAAYSAKDAEGDFLESQTVRDYLYSNVLNRKTDHTVTVDHTAPITENFAGISATIYHCFPLMNDALWGRNYTEQQVGLEMDRLKSSGIKTVRSYFSSLYAWDDTANSWNWNSDEMQRVYKWASMLQDRGIEVGLQAGWSIGFFAEPTMNESDTFAEVSYLHGDGDDLFGESTGVTLTGTAEQQRIQKASLRYGEWMARALNAFRARGINNVKYLFVFTEPDDRYGEAWIEMLKGLNTKLNQNGLRKTVKTVGPNQTHASDSGNTIVARFFSAVKNGTIGRDALDVLSTHTYPNGGDESIYEESFYHDKGQRSFQWYKSMVQDNGWDKDFWMDEFFLSSANDGSHLSGNGMQMTQIAACMTSAMNNGISRVVSWQLFDQLWVFNKTLDSGVVANVFAPFGTLDDGGQFICGVHLTGTAPTFPIEGYSRDDDGYNAIRSYTPRVNYYGLNLLGRMLGDGDGKVYSTVTDSTSGLYAGAVERSDGKLAVLVVNTTSSAQNIAYSVASIGTGSAKRYLYDPTAITPTAEAAPIESDLTLSVTEGRFYDTLNAGSFAVYVLESLEYTGDDIDISVDDMD